MKNNELYHSANSLMRNLGFVYALGIGLLDWPSVVNHFKTIVQSGLESERQIQIYVNILYLTWIIFTSHLMSDPRA